MTLLTKLQPKRNLTYRIVVPSKNGMWETFIKYETKEECINYLEKVNPKLRPAQIITGQRLLRAYDYGIVDYENMDELAQENQELRDGLWEIRKVA